VHQILLTSKCPHCHQKSQILGFYTHPGYCRYCQRWLGTRDGTPSPPDGFSDEYRICRNIGELLKLAPHVDPEGIRATLRQNLRVYCDQLATGNMCALADYVGHRSGNVSTWLDGTQVPQFKILLGISKRLSVPLAKLFDPLGPTSNDIDRAKEAIHTSGTRNAYTFRRADEIRAALVTAAKDPTLPSLLDVARQLGYTNTNRLRLADIELCGKIQTRFRDSDRFYRVRGRYAVRKCDPAVAKRALKDALRSKADTPLTQIALALGYSDSGSLTKLFPVLCAAMISKNRRLKAERLKALRRGLEVALVEDPPPSMETVTHRLGYSTSTVLKENEPELMSRLAERYRQSFKSRGPELERQVEPLLAEDPVPSVKEVCIRLDISRGFLTKYAPELVKKIAQKRQEWKNRDLLRRRAQLAKDVHDIAFDLDREGVLPTAKRIIAALPAGHTGGWQFLAKAILDAQEDVRDAHALHDHLDR
jgi:AraC-like DNA-binding protein